MLHSYEPTKPIYIRLMFLSVLQSIKALFGKQTEYAADFMLPENDIEKFEKALKLYLFTRQVPMDDLNDELADQLRHLGHVGFSLIITYAKERTFELDYLQFINDELHMLMDVPKHKRSGLIIQPDEIDEIELQDTVRLTFEDSEEKITYNMTYNRQDHSLHLQYR